MLEGLPDDLGQCGVGVVGVENRCFGAAVLLFGQQCLQLVALGGEIVVAGVENLRYGAPPGPCGQDALFGQGGRARGSLQGVEHL